MTSVATSIVPNPEATWVQAPQCRRYVLRADPRQVVVVAAHYGWPMPERMLRARSDGERASLWLGPDEWLLLGTASTAQSAPMPSLAHAHSLVDVSERQLALEIAGKEVEDLLQSACPLDLCAEAFSVGNCTRTIFGRCEIVLWRMEAQRFRLECGRSYLPYVTGLLQLGAA